MKDCETRRALVILKFAWLSLRLMKGLAEAENQWKIQFRLSFSVDSGSLKISILDTRLRRILDGFSSI